jgi:hypothetical protein
MRVVRFPTRAAPCISRTHTPQYNIPRSAYGVRDSLLQTRSGPRRACMRGKVRRMVFLSANATDVLSTTRSMGFTDSEVLIVPNERELFAMHVANMVKASLEVTRPRP